MAKKQKINFQTPTGVAKYPHLLKPDTAFDSEGKYKSELLLSQEDAKPLIKIIEDAAKEEHGKAHYRVPYMTDEETGEVAFKLQSHARCSRHRSTDRWEWRSGLCRCNDPAA